ncbi:chromosome segregation ATPase [Aliivibrio logei]|uniref:Chromosome partitioning protein ParA n=1 Tax=Aliivibrio logei 5S-186 TaxID=626086 RepID=A0ABX3AUH5_ALILO|nr:chromosome segregation ATPase [Aliivibrio logei]OEF11856.1 chromosome partitioning protein ParA [Aliivibrio logei 5S-186]
MKKYLFILPLLLVGCDDDDINANNNTDDDVQSVIEKTPELIGLLQSQETINDQFGVLYEQFEPLLDRSDSLTGVDVNNDGIRDDIEAFIEALEVEEPVRNALKQNARYTQENLYYDFTEKTDTNIDKAMTMGAKYDKVIACKKFTGIPVRDRTNTGRTIRALTYNTKARTMAYLAYNHLKNGSVSTSLNAEAQYCE